MDRPFAQALHSTIDGGLWARRAEGSAEPHRMLDAAHVLADVVRSGGRLIVVGTDERRSDVAHMSVEFAHPAIAIANARRCSARHLDAEELRAQGRAGDACVVFARTTVNATYRETVAAARACGMTTIVLVPGVGVPDGRADQVIGVGGGAQDSFVTTYHVLWDVVQVLLARGPLAA